MCGFNVIRVHVTIEMGVAKHSWTSWPRPLPLCPYEAFSKVGDYVYCLLRKLKIIYENFQSYGSCCGALIYIFHSMW